ncbi:MAG: hypothetical protein AAFU60_11475 [Bacteroidota bacterium]
MRGLFLAYFLCWSSLVLGQIGWSGAYQNFEAPSWNLSQGPEGVLLKNGSQWGLSYHWPTPYRPVRMVTRGYYAAFQQRSNPQQATVRSQSFSFSGGLKVSPLLFLLNCDCQDLKKGLFIGAEINYSSFLLEYKLPRFGISDRANAVAWEGNLGFQFNYGDHIYIFPTFVFQYYPEIRWEGLEQIRTPESDYFFREESFLRLIGFRLEFVYQWKTPGPETAY